MGMVFLLTGCASLIGPERIAPTLPPAPQSTQASEGSIWNGGNAIALFEDQKARRVGDVLTVLLAERTDASKKASTKTSKESDTDIANPTLFGRPLSYKGVPIGAIGMNSSSEFAGSGDSSQSNKLEGSISVTVAAVLANGNLVVRGEKNIELNQGAERVALEGIVRPADISPANTISSDRVADARITYNGSGALADSNASGWLARFFSSPWMPF